MNSSNAVVRKSQYIKLNYDGRFIYNMCTITAHYTHIGAWNFTFATLFLFSLKERFSLSKAKCYSPRFQTLSKPALQWLIVYYIKQTWLLQLRPRQINRTEMFEKNIHYNFKKQVKRYKKVTHKHDIILFSIFTSVDVMEPFCRISIISRHYILTHHQSMQLCPIALPQKSFHLRSHRSVCGCGAIQFPIQVYFSVTLPEHVSQVRFHFKTKNKHFSFHLELRHATLNYTNLTHNRIAFEPVTFDVTSKVIYFVVRNLSSELVMQNFMKFCWHENFTEIFTETFIENLWLTIDYGIDMGP